jgi:hypothetical protein
MDPLITNIPRTGTYGDMPFPVTLVNVPKKETGHNPSVQTMMTATMTMPILKINAIDFVEDEWVTLEEGEMFYRIFKKALQQGSKIQFSVKGLELDGFFFDKAICQLYGDFPQEVVDNNIVVVDIEEADQISLRDMKRMRRFYYYDRAFYDHLISKVDPILGFDEDDFDDDDEEPSPYDDDEDDNDYKN